VAGKAAVTEGNQIKSPDANYIDEAGSGDEEERNQRGTD